MHLGSWKTGDSEAIQDHYSYEKGDQCQRMKAEHAVMEEYISQIEKEEGKHQEKEPFFRFVAIIKYQDRH